MIFNFHHIVRFVVAFVEDMIKGKCTAAYHATGNEEASDRFAYTSLSLMLMRRFGLIWVCSMFVVHDKSAICYC